VCERSEVMGSLPPQSETAAGPGTIRRGAPEDAAFLARCNVDHGLVRQACAASELLLGVLDLLQCLTEHMHDVLQEVEHLRLDPAEVRAGVDAVLADDTKGHYWVLEVG
jgi:hypothetical protein